MPVTSLATRAQAALRRRRAQTVVLSNYTTGYLIRPRELVSARTPIFLTATPSSALLAIILALRARKGLLLISAILVLIALYLIGF